jgi:hypothetical protein
MPAGREAEVASTPRQSYMKRLLVSILKNAEDFDSEFFCFEYSEVWTGFGYDHVICRYSGGLL